MSVENNSATATEQPLFLTRHDAVNRYRLSLRTIDTMLAEGVLPSVRLSARCLRIPRQEADDKLLSYKVGGVK